MKPHKPIYVRTTVDHRVGPHYMGFIAVAKGQIRLVKPTGSGVFWTSSDRGDAFGSCQIGDGWERASPNDGDVAAYVDRMNRDKRLTP